MMRVKVVEGDLVKSITDEDVNLEDIIKYIECGYILIIVKEGNKFEEGYIFVEDGEIVGYYYTDNQSVEILGDKEKVMELLNRKDKTIMVYKYDSNKMNLMKWLYPEIFTLKKDKKEKIDKEDTSESEKYLNIKLDIPLDNPLALDVKDIKQYLNKNKYILITTYRKSAETYEYGYIIYKGEYPIAAAYECNMGVLLGEDAYKKIMPMLDDENTTIDVYEYDEKKLELLLETYPKMKLKYEKEDENIKEKEEKAEATDIINKEIEGKDALTEIPEEDTNLSREELLKRLGIKEPDEEWIENLVEELFRPSDEELKELKEKIEREIKEKLKEIEEIENVETNLTINWENGRYYIIGNITVKRRRILGIIKKDVDASIIKLKIDKIIKKYLQTYTTRISLNII